jgi:cytochrome c oxidase cbb3-type subunit 3
MTAGWGIYVALLVLINVVGALWLLFATAKKPEQAEEDTTGHVWDEDLTEYNKPLPRWWLGLFLLTVVFTAGYLVFYPGFGTAAGTLGWTSTGEVKADLVENNRRLEAVFSRFRDRPIEELTRDAEAVNIGRNVFVNNCAACHGSDARGAKGYPNLTDNDWLYGGTPDQVLTTIENGRGGVMPPLGAALGDQGINEVGNYVLTLSGGKADPALSEAGKARFITICAACHGPEGKGNIAIGAPNLTDNIWLYGSTLDDIKASIRDGRSGKMPAWGPIIGKDRARLVEAWVLAQSSPAETTPEKP